MQRFCLASLMCLHVHASGNVVLLGVFANTFMQVEMWCCWVCVLTRLCKWKCGVVGCVCVCAYTFVQVEMWCCRECVCAEVDWIPSKQKES